MVNKLYGNGINDDYPAIQEMLDSSISEVCLPEPEKCYMISKTLKIHGGQTLKLGRFTTIKLLPMSNCAMIEDDDFYTYKENICIDGGIWEMNNLEQEPNPYHFAGRDGKTYYDRRKEIGFDPSTSKSFPDMYTGICMRFCRVKNLIIKNLTFKNPVIYGAQLAYCEYFTIRDIVFDYTIGNPKLWNMDGVHIEGYCKYGTISNLKGACHDDLVAITSDDGLYGPIENIVVDGIFAEGSHSAVRLLSHGIPVKNIKISNVYGSYYVYCIGLTKYHGGDSDRGNMKNIIIENVSACACEGTKDVAGGNYPFIWVEKGLDIDGLSINNISREEKTYKTPLLKIDSGAKVKKLRLSDIYQKSYLDGEVPLLAIDGETEILKKENIINE